MNWKFYRPYRDKLIDKKNKVLGRIFDKRKKDADLDPSKINRILFLRTDGKIGDYIISSFIFREIKKYYPNIKIDVVSDKSLEDLLKLNKNIDEYYIFDRKKIFEWRKTFKNIIIQSAQDILNQSNPRDLKGIKKDDKIKNVPMIYNTFEANINKILG